jgi:hypothetical protein
MQKRIVQCDIRFVFANEPVQRLESFRARVRKALSI